MKKKTIIFFWALAVIITLGASIYQRKTGPTVEKRAIVSINNKDYKLSFPRSASEDKNTIILNIQDTNVKAILIYRKYPTNDKYKELNFQRKGNNLLVSLPVQPKAGKLEYYVKLNDKLIFQQEPLIVRFKGNVPLEALIPHILLMFISMLFASYGLILTIANKPNIKRYIILTITTLLLGGFVFGPIVQKYAFGVYWSGLPFGYDLTDNKTLIALVTLLLLTLPFLKKKILRFTSMIAFLIMISIFCIPHSLRGSELNQQTGVVGTSK